jgi:protoporphyrin/coproporphyrin ferrochelatase
VTHTPSPAAGSSKAGPDPYDGILLLSFGGPEAPPEVMPFLQNVTRGRGIPQHRLEAVAEHYLQFGGRSPINDQNRALLAALQAELTERGLALPVYWGNRNWHPLLADALRQAHQAGARRLAVIATSAYSSYSGCRQYREDLARALTELAVEGRELTVDKIRHYFNHPGFVEPTVQLLSEALAGLDAGLLPDSRVLFVTHSIPIAMNQVSGAEGGGYLAQHLDACAQVVDGVGRRLGSRPAWDLVFCSRSGSPHQPWLEPDIGDHLAGLAGQGVRAVVVVPIGFVSDHMEVVYDLDTEAAQIAAELGLGFVRVPTVGTDPRFVRGLVDLVLERAGVERGEAPERVAVGGLEPVPDRCPLGCCRNLRAELPAACGVDWAGPLVAAP